MQHRVSKGLSKKQVSNLVYRLAELSYESEEKAHASIRNDEDLESVAYLRESKAFDSVIKMILSILK